MTRPLAEIYDSIAENFAEAAIAIRIGPTTSPEPPEEALPDLPFTDTPQGRSAQGGCPEHGVPWTIREAGVSKATGQPYNAFWKCDAQNDDGSYCRQKPTPAWVKAHPAK